jgi:hypothetical protein
MSQENVGAFKGAIEAANHQDVEAFLAHCDPEVEWPRPAILMSLGGEAKVYRGHEGVREVLEDVFEAFAELHLEISEIRDLEDRIVAIGRASAPVARGVGPRPCRNSATSSTSRTTRRFGFRRTSIAMKPSEPPGCRSSDLTRPRSARL